MSLSAFDDKASPPDANSLRLALGRSSDLWIQLTADLQSAHGPLAEEWNFSSAAAGWSFRLKRGKRTIVYMTPCRAHFIASFALGEKACAAARASRLPSSVLATIEAAPRYAEGRGVRFVVKSKTDVASIEKLAAIKLAN